MRDECCKNIGPTCDGTTTCEPSHRQETTASMLSAAGSPAKTSALPEKEPVLPVQGPVFGTSSLGSLGSFDRDTSSWRTSQRCFLEEWIPYSETFPRSGMTRSGMLFQLQPLVHRTAEIVSGSWPTPSASQMPCEGSVRLCRQRWLAGDVTLEEASAIAKRDVRKSQGKVPAMLPTPTVEDSKNNGGPSQSRRNTPPLNAVAGGKLNPQWVEWLMGFPIGWTDLDA